MNHRTRIAREVKPAAAQPGKVLATACMVAACCTTTVQAQAMRKVEYRTQLDARGNLRVWNMAGSIRVTGWEKDSVIVRGAVPADQHFSCGGGGAGMKCAVDLAAKYDGKAPGSTLEILVPRTIQLWIKSSSADITISNFRGDLDAYSVTGRIRVDGDTRVLTLESMAGALDVLAGSAALRAKTGSGDIRLTGDAEEAEVASVSGNIEVAASRIRHGRFESINGNTTWRGPVTANAVLEFSSHGGIIALHIPAATAADVNVSSFQGSFNTTFAVADRLPARETKGRDLQFTLPGDNPARITIRNFKGPVQLLKQ